MEPLPARLFINMRLWNLFAISSRSFTSDAGGPQSDHPKTPKGRFDREVVTGDIKKRESDGTAKEPPNDDKKTNANPYTGEVNGPKGPEPTRYGDWERKGRVSDF